ncbi:alpha/beta hydrolase [Treponema sp. OMZ 840]|uniref:alpha/beta hydrolase n=1 Tax=Treponema sp. OMZ 840 TaxID=244313 RepID=UPI003D90882E
MLKRKSIVFSSILVCLFFSVSLLCNAENMLTDEKVASLARKELTICRNFAYYPHAFNGDFEQFYVDFHKLSRKLRKGITVADYDAVIELGRKREKLIQIVKNPKDTVWDIWGKKMACESYPKAGWDVSYDNEGFRPFLNPYLNENQKNVKGNVIIIAGGANTHRCNQVEGYPVAAFFRANGYNAYVLQRRVLPYADIDAVLDLARAVRYIRYNAKKLGIGKPDTIIAVGFSAGGMNIMTAIAEQYGHVTPDKYYSDYICDAVDAESADITVAVPIYGVVNKGLDYSKNINIPPIFSVVGQNDEYFSKSIPASIEFLLSLKTDVSFWVVPDAKHGFGLSTGVKNYVNGYTVAQFWPEILLSFLDTQLGYKERVIKYLPN